MFEFFHSLIHSIDIFVGFFINFFSGIVHFFLMLGRSMVYLFSCIAYMPPFIVVFLYAIIGLAIILQIINHGG